MALPSLIFSRPTPGAPTAGVTLAVYAPFGTDPVLSRYPGEVPLKIADHPLVAALVAVARRGVHVSALIDLVADDTWLVEITAGKTTSPRLTSRWKQAMDAPTTLSGFLRHTRAQRPGTAIVLALEGHGAGFLPDLDWSQLTPANVTRGGTLQWELSDDGAVPEDPAGAPLLPMGHPLLPMGHPLLPLNHRPLSTWGLGQALRDTLTGGGERIAVIHFANCFNMSVELLHTVAPYAEFATGYMNYNFFTAGASYPAVFEKLALAGSATTQQLATWLAEGNRELLDSLTLHPTVGGVVQLSRLNQIAARVDALAKALITALTAAPAAARPLVVARIAAILQQAQQYDSLSPFKLDIPDELTDLCSLAAALRSFDVGASAPAVVAAATALATALKGIKAYGAKDHPWVDPTATWDFSSPALAMNILCPDPGLNGIWDWRSPYYLQVEPDPALPNPQPNVIDFLRQTAWAAFIIEYHRQVPFRRLLPALIPEFPVFNRKAGKPKSPSP